MRTTLRVGILKTLAFNASHQPFHAPPANLHGYALSGAPGATPGRTPTRRPHARRDRSRVTCSSSAVSP